MGLEFVERGFDFPAVVIERGELGGRSLLVLQNGGNEPIQWLGAIDAVQTMGPPENLWVRRGSERQPGCDAWGFESERSAVAAGFSGDCINPVVTASGIKPRNRHSASK
jgi:hypothetical protein